MNDALIIIEGPGKIAKISSMNLGMKFIVKATVGHIEELKKDGYDQTGIDKNCNFQFQYISGKKKLLDDINKIASKSKVVYIASDDDREGEGIAWHVYNRLTKTNQQKSKRITFTSISSDAIKKAIANPREININLVNAYLTRIALDIKLGYGLSKFVQQKVNLKSAGRVQSIALRLINERDKDIKSFIKRIFYQIVPLIKGTKLKHIEKNDVGYISDDFQFETKELANKYINQFIQNNKFNCIDRQIILKTQKPKTPYKTSTIQQDVLSKLKIPAKEVEKILQKLYESGWITYPRTDSTRIDSIFCLEAYEFIKNKFPDIANNSFLFNKNGSGAQDAHEAIRCVYINKPILLNSPLESNENKVYELIYKRTFINFLDPMKYEETNYKFQNNKDVFGLSSKKIIAKGYTEFLNDTELVINDNLNFNINETYAFDNFLDMTSEKETSAPKKYNQATLISKLEKNGIGRPSTYSSLVTTNNDRGYTHINAKTNILEITPDGIINADILQKEWSDIVRSDFTKDMEEKLDEIASGKLNYLKYLKNEIDLFEKKLYEKIPRLNNNQMNLNKIEGICPLCSKDTFRKTKKDGDEYIVCSAQKYDFNSKKIKGCKYIKWINKEDK